MAAPTDQETIGVSGVISNPPTEIVFLTSAQIIERNEPSNIITIQLLGADGNPAVLTSSVTVYLTTTSTTGDFSKNKTPFVDIHSVTINPGSSTSSFYYKDTSVGTFNLSAQSTGLTPDTQPVTVRDTTPPSTPVIINPQNGQNITSTRNPSISGIADIGTDVIVTIGNVSYTVSPDNNGNWNITWPVELSNGNYTVYAKSIDEYGNESPSASVNFTINIVTPTPTPSITPTPTPTPTVAPKITVNITVDNITNSYSSDDVEPKKSTFNNTDMNVAVKPSIDKPIANVKGYFESVEYDLTDSNGDGIYETNIISPWYTGQYILKVVVTYEDGQTEELDVVILVDPFGYVYELIGDDQQRVKGAKVILWVYKDGKWIQWDAKQFDQINPQITAENGEYGFIVPEGLYYLTCEKEGYVFYQSHTMYVEEGKPVNINILMRRIGLMTLTEKIIQFIKDIMANMALVFAPFVFSDFSQGVFIPLQIINLILLLLAYLLYILINMSLLSPFSNILARILSGLGFIQKPKKNWGVVYDAENKKPLAMVNVKIYDVLTNKVLETQTTGSDGKYGFLVSPGTYYIDVYKKDYTFPSKLVSDDYHKQKISIKNQQSINLNIPMDPDIQKLSMKIRMTEGFRKFIEVFRYSLFIVGTVLTFMFAVVDSNLLNVILFSLYVLFWLYEIYNFVNSTRMYSNILDSNTKDKLNLSIVRLFNSDGKLEATKVSNDNGSFNFLVKKGSHYMVITRAQYQQFKTGEKYYGKDRIMKDNFGLEPN